MPLRGLGVIRGLGIAVPARNPSTRVSALQGSHGEAGAVAFR